MQPDGGRVVVVGKLDAVPEAAGGAGAANRRLQRPGHGPAGEVERWTSIYSSRRVLTATMATAATPPTAATTGRAARPRDRGVSGDGPVTRRRDRGAAAGTGFRGATRWGRC